MFSAVLCLDSHTSKALLFDTSYNWRVLPGCLFPQGESFFSDLGKKQIPLAPMVKVGYVTPPLSSPELQIDPRLWETLWEKMRRRVLIAKYWLFEPYGACSLLVPREVFDCSSRKPMRRIPQSSSLPQSREELWGRDWLHVEKKRACVG